MRPCLVEQENKRNTPCGSKRIVSCGPVDSGLNRLERLVDVRIQCFGLCSCTTIPRSLIELLTAPELPG